MRSAVRSCRVHTEEHDALSLSSSTVTAPFHFLSLPSRLAAGVDDRSRTDGQWNENPWRAVANAKLLAARKFRSEVDHPERRAIRSEVVIPRIRWVWPVSVVGKRGCCDSTPAKHGACALKNYADRTHMFEARKLKE